MGIKLSTPTPIKYDGLGHINFNTLGITIITNSSMDKDSIKIVSESSESGIFVKDDKIGVKNYVS